MACAMHEPSPKLQRVFSASRKGIWAPVGEGVSELRIHYGPGYRVYFVRRGSVVVVMLGGGDKSTQARDIELAKSLERGL
jgi:putative addiction module killer protein